MTTPELPPLPIFPLAPETRRYAEIVAARERIMLARIAELEDRLFANGDMGSAPCFCCGYNGPGYFQPNVHPCAARHHAAIDAARGEG